MTPVGRHALSAFVLQNGYWRRDQLNDRCLCASPSLVDPYRAIRLPEGCPTLGLAQSGFASIEQPLMATATGQKRSTVTDTFLAI
jgi:hypothetical protein